MPGAHNVLELTWQADASLIMQAFRRSVDGRRLRVTTDQMICCGTRTERGARRFLVSPCNRLRLLAGGALFVLLFFWSLVDADRQSIERAHFTPVEPEHRRLLNLPLVVHGVMSIPERGIGGCAFSQLAWRKIRVTMFSTHMRLMVTRWAAHHHHHVSFQCVSM
jgi:hypothetical protein